MTHHVGFYGKTPAAADFVVHGLDDAFTRPWHAWMEAGLAISQAQLQEKWLEYYLVAPVWHFALSTGLGGADSITGVFIPSVDRVGRYYPFTLAEHTKLLPAFVMLECNAWHQALAELSLQTLQEDVTLQHIITALSKQPPLAQQSMHLFWHAETQEATTLRPLAITGEHPGASLLHTLLAPHGNFHSLWWTEGSEHIAPVCLLCEGFPSATQFAGLLDGQWSRWGWHAGIIANTA
jgi:type VI secretion system protein ImpM